MNTSDRPFKEIAEQLTLIRYSPNNAKSLEAIVEQAIEDAVEACGAEWGENLITKGDKARIAIRLRELAEKRKMTENRPFNAEEAPDKGCYTLPDGECVGNCTLHAGPFKAEAEQRVPETVHHTCEDPWYSCPLSEYGCANDQEKGCTCGAEQLRIAEVERFEQAIEDAVEATLSFPRQMYDQSGFPYMPPVPSKQAIAHQMQELAERRKGEKCS